jgi:hypothetical protein
MRIALEFEIDEEGLTYPLHTAIDDGLHMLTNYAMAIEEDINGTRCRVKPPGVVSCYIRGTQGRRGDDMQVKLS